MKDSAQALHDFWSSFGWTAYDTSTVPSEDLHPVMPRITYDVATSEFESEIALSASLWSRSMKWDEVSQKADEIYNAIGLGGIIVPYSTGKLWIKRGSPFSQRMPDPDDTIRRIYINVIVEFFTSK